MTQVIGWQMKNILLACNPVNILLDSLNQCLDNIRNFISRVIPEKTLSIDVVKEDVWRDLSAVYYKYDDGVQKKAFREILSEISNRINDGNWDTVYRKLHSIETTPTTLRRL